MSEPSKDNMPTLTEYICGRLAFLTFTVALTFFYISVWSSENASDWAVTGALTLVPAALLAMIALWRWL